MKEKNLNIELLRVVFMIVICLWHFRGVAPSFNNGYLAVEFFFILSGFLLYKSFCRHPEISVSKFILKKIKVFYPAYIIMFIPTMIIRWRAWIPQNYDFDGIVSIFNIVIRDVFLIGGLEFLGGYPLNFPLWYITYYLLVSYFLYTLLKFVGEFSIHICFIFSFFCYTYLFNASDSLDVSSNIDFHELVRGLAGMSLGIFLSSCNSLQKSRMSNKFFSIFILMIIVSLFYCYSLVHYDCYAILIYSILVLLLSIQYNYKFIVKKILLVMGGVTYEMLCVHCSISQAFAFLQKKVNLPWFVSMSIYLILVIISAIILNKLTNVFRKKFIWFQL